MKYLSQKYYGLSIVVLAFLTALIMSFYFKQAIVYDSTQYEQLGFNLSQGNGFSDSLIPPFLPTATREPLYPLFIGAIYKIFGRHHEVVLFAQALLHAITTFLTYSLAKRFLSLYTSYLAGIMVAIDPTVSGFCSYLLTEPLTLFLIICFIYLMAGFEEKNGLLFAVIGGALLGLITLCRAIFMFMPFFIWVMLIFTNRQALKRRVIQGVVLIATFTIVVAPWVYRNMKEFNVAAITTRSGHLLLWRAMRLEYTPREMLVHIVYGASDTLGRTLFPDDYSKMTVRGEWGTASENIYTAGEKIYQDYRAQGYSELEADRMLQDKAIEMIEQHPIKYILQSFLELWKLSFFEIVPFAYSDKFNELMQSSSALFVIGKTLRIGLRYYYSWFILALAAVGVIKGLKTLGWRRCAILLCPVVYVTITGIIGNASPRYLFPSVPFIMIFAASAFFSNHLKN